MLIINDDHLRRADVRSLDELCPSCRKPLKEYPLLLSDEAGSSVYHVTCALQLATEILVDLFTFFDPPTPYARPFILTGQTGHPTDEQGGAYAVNGS